MKLNKNTSFKYKKGHKFLKKINAILLKPPSNNFKEKYIHLIEKRYK